MSNNKERSRLSLIKSNVNKVIELKQRAKATSGQSLFSYVPESIINHKNNQQHTAPLTGGSRNRSSETNTRRNNGRITASRPASCDDNNMQRSSISQLRNNRDTSPLAKVQFEDMTIETKDEKDRGAQSDSTEPLVTDSYSGEDEREVYERSIDGETGAFRRDNRHPAYEQWGYDPRKLNRIKFRREHELEEFNFGIDFTKINKSKEQQKRLRQYLMKHQLQLNDYVEMGTGPVFGYPPICYSPPAELKDNSSTPGNEAISVLMKHIFQKDENLTSVQDYIKMKNTQQNFMTNLIKRFMQKKHLRGNAPMEDGYRSVGGRSSVFSGDQSPDGRTKANNFGEASRTSKFGIQDGTRNSTMKSNEYGLEHSSGVFRMKAKKSRTVKPSSRERTTRVTNITLKHGFNERKNRSIERNRSNSALSGGQKSTIGQEKALKPHTETVSLRNSTKVTKRQRPVTSSLEFSNKNSSSIRVRRIVMNKNRASSSTKAASPYRFSTASGNIQRHLELNQYENLPLDVANNTGHFVSKPNQQRHTQEVESQRWGDGQVLAMNSKIPVKERTSVQSINSQSTKPSQLFVNNTQGGGANASTADQQSISGSRSSQNMLGSVQVSNPGERIGIKTMTNYPGPTTSMNFAPSIGESIEPYTLQNSASQINPLQFQKPRMANRSLHKSVSHTITSQALNPKAILKQGMPIELIYTQEDRNSKIQIQNFKVYRELRRKMEVSIQRQRKALKQSISQYVATDDNKKNPHAKLRAQLRSNLTDRKLIKKRMTREREIGGYTEVSADGGPSLSEQLSAQRLDHSNINEMLSRGSTTNAPREMNIF